MCHQATAQTIPIARTMLWGANVMERALVESQASAAHLDDALPPRLIVHAVYEGHRYARELETSPTGEVAFKRHFHGAEVAAPT